MDVEYSVQTTFLGKTLRLDMSILSCILHIHPFYLTWSVEFIHKCIFLHFKNNHDVDDDNGNDEEEDNIGYSTTLFNSIIAGVENRGGVIAVLE